MSEKDRVSVDDPNGRESSGDDAGTVRMIDVSMKTPTVRTATATGRLHMAPEVLQRIRDGRLEKGDAFGPARIAAIMAAKKTPDILPLCHPLRLSGVDVDLACEGDDTVQIRVTVRGEDRTGVEMEALTAVTVAGLTVYDVCKIHGQNMRLTDVCLETKTGGKSGDYRRSDATSG